ncbi:MAG: hypothetical protein QW764_04805 [Desulfurococcaceae archaeon]
MSNYRDVNNQLDKVSFRAAIFIVVMLYLVLGSYWFYVTLMYSPMLVLKFQMYKELLKETWWILTYYSSEFGLSIGIVFRWVAGILAAYVAAVLLKGGLSALARVKGKAGVAILLEGLYILTYAPSAFLGFVYPIAESRNLWYFEPRPPWMIVFLVAGLACLGMVTIVAPPIFKLGLKLIRNGSIIEIAKWASITGVSYLFAMFWWNYTMCWIATLVKWPERAQPGIGILYNPISAASFIITVIGLLLIAVIAFKSIMPAVKGKPDKVNKRRVGFILIAFGGYFILMLILYAAAGGYYAQPTTWMEIIGPHNPDLWCIGLIIPGLLLTRARDKSSLS